MAGNRIYGRSTANGHVIGALREFMRENGLSGEFSLPNEITVRLEGGKLHCRNDWAEQQLKGDGRELRWYLDGKCLATACERRTGTVLTAYDAGFGGHLQTDKIDFEALGFKLKAPYLPRNSAARPGHPLKPNPV